MFKTVESNEEADITEKKSKFIANIFYITSEEEAEEKIRQIKSLGNSKLLLVSNGGTLMTETVEAREISVIAKLERIEIKL